MVAKFTRPPSAETFASARADEAAATAAKRFRKRGKYPGRHRVLDRDDAADFKMRQFVNDRDNRTDRFACSQPYVISGIGLPRATTAMNEWRWGRPKGPIPIEFDTRCRRCENCLKHRRRLWTARAIDELRASTRTWFGTLTIEPWQRFQYTLQAATLAKRAGHGEWRCLERQTKFRFLVQAIGPDITKFFKRVRRKSGAPIRYLLVSEAHKDGFPHFHLMLHEQDGPVRKAFLEEEWLVGNSHWRLVPTHDAKTAYYICKYLSKDAQTRIRGSVRYGQGRQVAALTERLQKATRQLAENTPRLLDNQREKTE